MRRTTDVAGGARALGGGGGNVLPLLPHQGRGALEGHQVTTGAFPCGIGIDLVDSGLVDRFRRPRHSLWCVSGIRGVVALELACVLAAIEA